MSFARVALCVLTSTSHVSEWEMEGRQSLINPQSTLLPLVFSFSSSPRGSSQATHNPPETISVHCHCIFEFPGPSF